ncbi:MAG TPA: OmpA family protein, partial [Thermodesulfobacteriota bacterium]|nr:OmpA family protein [Thermodesulfobacteriota bacterium]
KLKIYIVGHTDNVGTFDSNVKLSQARAASVVSALVNKQGIAALRLIPFGAGPTSPVASNKDEKGRAQNRRVELVAQ